MNLVVPEPESQRMAPAGQLRLSLLRGFELSHDAGHVVLPLSVQRLLAFLALQARPLLRQYVASTLWLEFPEGRAHGCLRTALWRLRRARHDPIELRAGTISLSSRVLVDVSRVVAVRRSLSDRGREVTGEDLDALLNSGDLLPGWYEDWVLAERERINQMRVQALELASERLVDSGRPAEAVVAGLAAVEAEPLRESAHLALIKAHRACGNRVEALRQYHRYARALDEELGVKPPQEIRDVAMSIFQ